MSTFATLSLWGWPVACLAFFSQLPPRRAVLVCVIGGYLFLPMASISLGPFPSYGKFEAIILPALLLVCAFDADRFLRLRIRWPDAAVAGLVAIHFISSLANGLGPGLMSGFEHVAVWGGAYLLGRAYFADREGIANLAKAIVIGGLIYVPLCLYEVRMSPQLHHQIYGFHQHVFAQTRRFGGWRPVVFMQHGLAVAYWMTAATLCAYWLWRTNSIRMFLGVRMAVWVAVLAGTTVLCKSIGALGLGVLGITAMELARSTAPRLALAGLIALVPAYAAGRMVAPDFSSTLIMDTVNSIPLISERSGSLNHRLKSEDFLINRAEQQLLYGWNYRFNPKSVEGYGQATPDGLWVIMLGKYGLIGLICWMTMMLAGPLMAVRQIPGRVLRSPRAAPTVGLTVVIVLWTLDCMLNAMVNPVLIAAAGGLVGLPAERRKPRP